MIIVLVSLVFSLVSGAAPKEAEMTRSPAVAGQFYPADPAVLAADVDGMLAAAPAVAPAGRIVAVQVPHAGYPYSGAVAARAFKLLAGMDSPTVVIVGTSHRVMLTGAAVYPRGAWRTPLGTVAVDEAFAADILAADDVFQPLPEAHRLEHSLEVQVPFLQRALGSFRIVPVMVLQPSWEECERMGRALAAAARGRSVVLVASTDLYHGESYPEAVRTDSLTTAYFAGFDPRALHAALAANRAQACGGQAVVVTMLAAQGLGANRAQVLEMTNSNDVTGERGGYCVGYSATVFTAAPAASGADADALSPAEQATVLELARRTVEEHARTGRRPGLPAAGGRLAEPRGVFVTLHRQGQLRGCIGYVEAVKPLLEAVREMAVCAASEDPRFPPVRPEELAALDVEVTVLSPLRRITDPESVEVGRHGLVVRRGGRSGLLLPQVPVEQGWDRVTFLEHTCLKAGLPTNAWQDPATELMVFTGQVFGEKDAR
jgi:hypothetical protein